MTADSQPGRAWTVTKACDITPQASALLTPAAQVRPLPARRDLLDVGRGSGVVGDDGADAVHHRVHDAEEVPLVGQICPGDVGFEVLVNQPAVNDG
jgi:hypothetical protein